MNRLFIALVSLGLFATTCSTVAKAEVVKQVIVDCTGKKNCFYWWPKLPALPGWHTDEDANFRYGGNGINTLVPDGFSFSNAETIMYANAVYKPRYIIKNPKTKNIDAYIEDDKDVYREEHKDISIAEVEPLTTGDGTKIRSSTFFRPNDKAWEQVTYYEEDDYYITFVISSKSEKDFRTSLPVYERLIKAYKK